MTLAHFIVCSPTTSLSTTIAKIHSDDPPATLDSQFPNLLPYSDHFILPPSTTHSHSNTVDSVFTNDYNISKISNSRALFSNSPLVSHFILSRLPTAAFFHFKETSIPDNHHFPHYHDLYTQFIVPYSLTNLIFVKTSLTLQPNPSSLLSASAKLNLTTSESQHPL